MPSIEITDDQRDRIEALRRELADAHAGSYASVTPPDVAAYLLDLADAVSDPDRLAEGDAADARGSFPRAELEAALTERNRRHASEADDAPMDLYSIAAAYDVAGRSNMTKGELVTAILDAVEHRYTDPLAPVDLDLPPGDGAETDDGAEADDGPAVDGAETDDGPAGGEAEADDGAETDDEAETDDRAETDDEAETDAETDSDGQLTAMLNLLETHRDKWREADGDARYEVELPDGSSETARTKDDVRATLFKHY